MSGYVETLNRWGENFWTFAWPMLWQSSLLIAVVFAFDWVFARRIRASVRYALWMIILVKLVLPPALALPTGATWWLWRPQPAIESPVIKNYIVSFANILPPDSVTPTDVPMVLPPPKLSDDAWVLLGAVAIGTGLFLWLAFRWLRVAAKVGRAATAPAELNAILDEARQLAGLRRRPRLKLIDDAQSPAVYGLSRPVVLLPRTLAARFSGRQLRAVLLHEAIHLRRGDVWMNCAQTLLQIAYWWHPLLWLANARIRRLREEAVDDAVMLALRDGANAYAPTLLEVAKYAFRRPLASLGLVGILESRSALRQRIERLVNFRPPRKAGITFLSACGIFAFSAVALPMGQGPAADEKPTPAIAENGTNTTDGTSNNARTNLSVTAPQMTNDLESLPSDNPPATKEKPKITVIVLDANGQMFLNNEPMTMPLLKERLEAITTRDPDPMVFIRAANNLAYQRVANLVDTLRQLKITRVSLRTEANPAETAPQPKASLTDKVASSPGPQYERRTFKVNPNIFYQIRNIPSNGPPKAISHEITDLVAQFFVSLGVNLDPPKTVYYNEGHGVLFVYATPQDLDVIEQAIAVLSKNPPKLHINARFIKVPQEFLSSALTKSMFADLTNGNGCILPNPELQPFLDEAKAQKEFGDVAEPEATLLSGNKVKMRAGSIVPLVTGYTLGTASAFVPHIEQVETGSSFDMTPTLLSDGYTIRLQGDASQTDFFGYANTRGLAPDVVTNAAGKRVKLPNSLPVVQTSRSKVDKLLYDGQTLVLFPGSETDLSFASDEKAKERISKAAERAKRKNGKIEIFLATVTVVDAAGNRAHSEDEMPFAQTAVPPQSP